MNKIILILPSFFMLASLSCFAGGEGSGPGIVRVVEDNSYDYSALNFDKESFKNKFQNETFTLIQAVKFVAVTDNGILFQVRSDGEVSTIIRKEDVLNEEAPEILDAVEESFLSGRSPKWIGIFK